MQPFCSVVMSCWIILMAKVLYFVFCLTSLYVLKCETIFFNPGASRNFYTLRKRVGACRKIRAEKVVGSKAIQTLRSLGGSLWRCLPGRVISPHTLLSDELIFTVEEIPGNKWPPFGRFDFLHMRKVQTKSFPAFTLHQVTWFGCWLSPTKGPSVEGLVPQPVVLLGDNRALSRWQLVERT